jgi:molybdopterin-containing oxidoreductase family iron-sulfur binding subunit
MSDDSKKQDPGEKQELDIETLRTERLEFLKKVGLGLLGGIAAPVLLTKLVAENSDSGTAVQDLPQLPPQQADESLVLRMMRDIQRALAKPVDQRHWGMVIDLRKCVGCKACTIACVAENKLPPGVVYRPVIEEEFGSYPNVGRRFLPRPCMQCEYPPCVEVCPVGATEKLADGIVDIDYDECIGCRYCVTACPYGSRVFDAGHYYVDVDDTLEESLVGTDAQNYESASTYEYDVHRKRKPDSSPIGNVRKCHFCRHRLNKGLLPECVTTCIGGATYIGDLNDPKSLVAELRTKPNVMRLKEEMGTQPSVYYLL